MSPSAFIGRYLMEAECSISRTTLLPCNGILLVTGEFNSIFLMLLETLSSRNAPLSSTVLRRRRYQLHTTSPVHLAQAIFLPALLLNGTGMISRSPEQLIQLIMQPMPEATP